MRRWACLLVVPLALPPIGWPASAQSTPAAVQAADAGVPAAALPPAELEQMLAPIALYPDDLLTQVLVASTYPLEVVMASRWIAEPAHASLKGDALLQALDAAEWDPSVKSLVPFPSVLKTMSEQLDWTQRLGDAFLAQQADVLAAVQTLRGRAQAAGTLKSTPQQTVTQEVTAIVIQPAQPDTVYVPAYDPGVAYGSWPYPSYPPVYYPPPPGAYLGSALATGLAFGTGIAITGALWGWGRPNWGGGSVNVNANRFNSINSNRYNNFRSDRTAITSGNWQHNANHRRGVSYGNAQLRQQYRPGQGGNPALREGYRGRTGGSAPAVQRPVVGPGVGPGAGGLQRPGNVGGAAGLQGKLQGANRPSAGAGAQRPAAGIQRPADAPQRPAGGLQRPAAGAQRPPGGLQRPPGGAQRTGGGGGLSGIGNGAGVRAQSAQGRASRGGMARAGGAPRAHGGRR